MTSNTIHVYTIAPGTTELVTFDAAQYKLLKATVYQVNEDETFTSYVEVTTDGIESYETQMSYSTSNSVPDSVSSHIYDDIVVLDVVPAKVPSNFTVLYDLVEAELYGEHTLPGKWIRSNTGFALANNRILVREANNNQNVANTEYSVSNILGPIVTGAELFDTANLVEDNGSTLVPNDDYTAIASSNQPRNSHYVDLEVEPGQIYQITANALYSYSETFSRDSIPDQYGVPTITVTEGDDVLLRQELTTTETAYTLKFVPTGNTARVSFGLSLLGTVLLMRDVSVQKLVPFHTYNQTTGTFFYSWTSAGSPVILFTIGANTLRVLSFNAVYFNNVLLGTATTINRIAIAFDGNTLTWCLNGGTPATLTNYINYGETLHFNRSPLQFSFTPELLSNNTLIELTNG